MKDLEKLIQYLEWHIAAMKNDLGYQSQVFISYGNCFQIQALQGQLRAENEGEFTIRCMVNIDKPADDIFSTYVGGEGVISIKNTQLFISSLRMTLNSFLQGDHPSL
ncbi:hypothetical protein [Nostoc sp. UIC 10630]|uniref:hypothetical protein n=1 Tax=Nostoc sp. UIC 10630 TaxID=2100146 RepID=UPI0013D69EEB|nr:hypothetical protein [Nostoc sp. UIC 10630]NEU84376.1 hypothetical protein [Nostoc sp. UIC 10630]